MCVWISRVILFLLICASYSYSLESICNDCSGHGECKNDLCQCYEGWQGPQCQFCSGKVKLTAQSGTILDGVGNYSIGTKCNWIIVAPNSSITLHLDEFVTECGWDHLYVFDGDSTRSPLLGAFSGFMYNNENKLRKIPELVAHSGYALIYFHSDDVYSMTGFNMKYRLNTCPSDNFMVDCSGHGICLDDSCLCADGWIGKACHTEKCPNDCWSSKNKGRCGNEGCICESTWKGSDCGQVGDSGYWEVVLSNNFSPPGSASHAIAIWEDFLYVVEGEKFSKNHGVNIYDFKKNLWKILDLSENSSIVPRFAHSVVQYGGELFMYGGFLTNQQPTAELWVFNINSGKWRRISYKSSLCETDFYALCAPLEIAGHSSLVITNPKNSTEDRMVVIFGYSPTYGFLNTVQEFYFNSGTWVVVKINGSVKGSYGHASSLDELTKKIYVYGGVVATGQFTSSLSSKLYSYDYESHEWNVLKKAPSAQYLHSATFISPGLMMVFGGNPFKDFNSQCYSSKVYTYDVACNMWRKLEIKSGLVASDLARYGNSAVLHNGSLYIYGGFDGQMLSDLLKYSPGNCSSLKTSTTCLNSQTGVKCIWSRSTMECTSIENLSRFNQSLVDICGKKPSGVSRSKSDIKLNNRNVKFCKKIYNCKICQKSSCLWNHEDGTCNKLSNNVFGRRVCSTQCSEYKSCKDCTLGDCIWCQNSAQCIDRNAYTAYFPYGQCQDWTTVSSKCSKESSPSPCVNHQTCKDCRENPACGWCDDGSGTGTGRCMMGGYSGDHSCMVTESKCPLEYWHFTSCPACQCNGHANCQTNTSVCSTCTDLTTGEHCSNCAKGTWGSALNGGKCKNCTCNKRATECHQDTGKCFCTSKGNIGDHCEKCETQNHYYEDPLTKECFYELTLNYQFTFNMSKETDRKFRNINLKCSPLYADKDVVFEITCSQEVKMNLTMHTSILEQEKLIFENYKCDNKKFRTRFDSSDSIFAMINNMTLITFYVNVYGIHPPIVMQISFSQHP